MIQGIEDKLRPLATPQTDALLPDLAALRTHLAGGQPVAVTIGPMLVNLGRKTGQVAKGQGAVMAASLNALGQCLTTAGQSLA
jgi:hypothetical protein